MVNASYLLALSRYPLGAYLLRKFVMILAICVKKFNRGHNFDVIGPIILSFTQLPLHRKNKEGGHRLQL